MFDPGVERTAALSERHARDMKVTDLRATAAVLNRLRGKLVHI